MKTTTLGFEETLLLIIALYLAKQEVAARKMLDNYLEQRKSAKHLDPVDGYRSIRRER